MLGHGAAPLERVALHDREDGGVAVEELPRVHVAAGHRAVDRGPERRVGELLASERRFRLPAPELGLGDPHGRLFARQLRLGDAHAVGVLHELHLRGLVLGARGLILGAGDVQLAARDERVLDQHPGSFGVGLRFGQGGPGPGELGLERAAAVADLLEMGLGRLDLSPRAPQGIGGRLRHRLRLLHGQLELAPVQLPHDLAGLHAVAQIDEEAGDGAGHGGVEHDLLPAQEAAGRVDGALHGASLDGGDPHGDRAGRWPAFLRGLSGRVATSAGEECGDEGQPQEKSFPGLTPLVCRPARHPHQPHLSLVTREPGTPGKESRVLSDGTERSRIHNAVVSAR